MGWEESEAFYGACQIPVNLDVKYYSWAEINWKSQSVMGLIPCYTLQRIAAYLKKLFCPEICCAAAGTAAGWPQWFKWSRATLWRTPSWDFCIILYRKDSECLSPWDRITSLRSNHIDTVLRAPVVLDWSETPLDLHTAVPLDWINPQELFKRYLKKTDGRWDKRIWPDLVIIIIYFFLDVNR